MTALVVEECSGLTTVQDRGRVGCAHLGVPRAGALDAPAADLANRLVGNHADEAVLEVLGSVTVQVDRGRWVAVTGSRLVMPRAQWLPAGESLVVGTDAVRSYLAVAGGLAVEPVLGSRSTDTLAWVGPPRVEEGASLPVGEPADPPRPLDVWRPESRSPLRLHPGPRADAIVGEPLATLCAGDYRVSPDSNRIGLRLEGPTLEHLDRDAELPSEGMVLGAVQVPPSGQPVVFLADHPTTGGYPVVAVVDPRDLWQCAQAAPGDPIRFTR